MIPAPFDYARPTSLDEALGMLAGGEAKILAGGQSLLPLMKLRLARPERLVDIGRLSELRGITRLGDGRLAVGALTTYREMLESPAVMSHAIMADALPDIGDTQVRNRGTLGGAISHADPAADMPAVVLALDAEIVARSASGGERHIHAAEFFVGPFETALRPDEIVIRVILPAGGTAEFDIGHFRVASDELMSRLMHGATHDVGSAYASIEQRASGYALVGVGVVILAAGGTIGAARVAITGASESVYRAGEVERALQGQPVASPDLAAAAAHATDGRPVLSDIHADAAYRAHLARTYVRRALERAIGRMR